MGKNISKSYYLIKGYCSKYIENSCISIAKTANNLLKKGKGTGIDISLKRT